MTLQVRKLASGAFGEVFRVHKGRLPAFAVKVARRASDLTVSAEARVIRDLQRRGGECARYFVSDAIPKGYTEEDLFEVKSRFANRPVLFMELLDDAMTFAELVETLQRGNDDAFVAQPHVVRSILHQIPRAFLCLFKLGYVHTDASAENVMIVRTGNGAVQVKLLDFGWAVKLPASMSVRAAMQSQARLREWYDRAFRYKDEGRGENHWPNLAWLGIADVKYGPFGEDIVAMYQYVRQFALQNLSVRSAPTTARRSKSKKLRRVRSAA
jgi:serine/threonine protein kinase